MSDPRAAYTPLQGICHWIIALLCAAEFPTAGAIHKVHIGRVFGLHDSTFDQLMAHAHEWGGWLILVLTALLLLSRFRSGVPALPSGMRTWQRRAAHAAHAAIYAGLAALTFSGAIAMYAGRLGVLHVALTKVGIGLIGVHVAAASWHQLIRRDRLLWRMWPW